MALVNILPNFNCLLINHVGVSQTKVHPTNDILNLAINPELFT